MTTKAKKKAQDKVHAVMSKMKDGRLRSGSGQKVTSRKQAIAIALSEASKATAKSKFKPVSHNFPNLEGRCYVQINLSCLQFMIQNRNYRPTIRIQIR